MGVTRWGITFVLLPLLCLLTNDLLAGSKKPLISIIIDDLGHNRSLADAALQLPHAVTLSILPYAPYSREISRRARQQGREYMLHLPMQGHDASDLEPGMLTVSMEEEVFITSLNANLNALTGYSGINNHKGSVLTANAGKVHLLLQTLMQREPLFLIDSKTTSRSKIPALVSQYSLPFASRNVFLDVDRRVAAIEKQLDRLLDIARKTGSAIAIGHPYPSTLAVLNQFLTDHQEAAYQLVPVSHIIKWRQHLTPAEKKPRRIPLALSN